MTKLVELLAMSEDRLIAIVLAYALKMGYTKYTSTLEEAWRLSIRVLSQTLIDACRNKDEPPDFGPEEDYTKDPIAEFGIIEARRHRERGISFGMFLGLFKYYRQTYLDLVIEAQFECEYEEKCRRFIDRFFDRIELGLCVEWAGVEQDSVVRELQDANRLMTNEKNKYLTIFESLPQPGLLLNHALQIENLNHAAMQLLRGRSIPGSTYYSHKGNPPVTKTDQQDEDSSIVGHPAGEIFPWLSEKISSFASGDSASISFEMSTKIDSRKLIFEVLISRMLDVSEKFTGLLIIFTNITERKRVERQLAQAQKLESIGQLAAGIAHEINTPTQYVNDNIRFIKDSCNDLSKVITICHQIKLAVKNEDPVQDLLCELVQALEQIDTEYLMEETPRALNQCLDGLGRVTKIVHSMKEFARPACLNQKTLFDINRAIETTVTVSRNEWKHVAEIKLDLAPDLPLIPCMAGELNQVFLNMIINAAHAIKDKKRVQGATDKGVIQIRTRLDDEKLKISISDNGCGIPEEIRDRIFDPFFSTKEVNQGTGQGLTIIHDVVVEKHKGSIDFTSEIEKGTTFFIYLPIRDKTNSMVV